MLLQFQVGPSSSDHLETQRAYGINAAIAVEGVYVSGEGFEQSFGWFRFVFLLQSEHPVFDFFEHYPRTPTFHHEVLRSMILRW